MKKIMILGASATQVPLIKCAKMMGLFTIVASIPGNYPGFAYADKVYYIDTTDIEEILKASKSENINGILTTGTDVAVRSIGYVNSCLGLSGITYESAKIVTDKSLMKEVLVSNGVRTAEFYKAFSINDAKKYAQRISYPVMIKCTDQAASKGISKVDSEEDIEEAFNYALINSKNNYVIVEKFIEGYEIGVDGYVDDTGTCMFIPHNKMIINNGMTNVPVGHSVPFLCDNDTSYKDICEQIKLCTRAVKIKSCFFNMDIMIANEKAYIIEIGGRTGSTCIPDMLSKFCGYDYYEKMIKNALGNTPDMTFEPQCACTAGFIMGNKNGKVIKINQIDTNILKNTEFIFDVKVNDEVHKFVNGADRIGQIICTAPTLDEATVEMKRSQDILGNCIIVN